MRKQVEQQMLKYLKYFSLEEREKREYRQYKKEYDRLFALSEKELDSKFVNTQARYRHKKNVSSLFLVAILLSVLSGVGFNLFEFCKKTLAFAYGSSANAEEIIKIGFFLSGVIFFCVAIAVFALLLYCLKDLRSFDKELLIIEEVRKAKNPTRT